MARKKFYDENGVEVKKRGGCLKWIGIALAVIIILTLIGSIVGGGDSDSNEVTTTESSSNESSEENSTSESSESDLPREYKNALKKAESYLGSGFHFSETGLRGQLEFEEFPQDAIDYAMENVEADYNEQAVKAAKSYAESDFAMSDQGVYDQLIFEGFTEEQAQHGLDSLD
ncbi:Ltp family lipoprotein [Jeotgalibaca porci]|uniref:Ltp family lipoprotein n=1 Tax=Jeotgalibaca porci TaxID=1868793 RepID=UPI0035A1D190